MLAALASNGSLPVAVIHGHHVITQTMRNAIKRTLTDEL